MNRVNSQAVRLIELYCEIELKNSEEEPRITKVFPKSYPDLGVLKILPSFAYPYKKRQIEK